MQKPVLRLLPLLLVLLALPMGAMAAEKDCLYVMNASQTVYELHWADGGNVWSYNPDETRDVFTNADQTRMVAVGSVSAGTPVNVTGSHPLDSSYVEIVYYTSGGASVGYVAAGSASKNYFVLTFPEGSAYGSYRVPNGMRNDVHAIQTYLVTQESAFGVTTDEIRAALALLGAAETTPPSGGSSGSSSTGGGSSSGGSSSGGSGSRATPRPVETVQVTLDGTPVTIDTLGLYESVIVLEGEKQTVMTAALSWSPSAEAEHALAVIYAPRTGAATMHSQSGGKGDVLKKCKNGRIVLVTEWGKNYCKILYNGAVGYVLTDALKLYPHDWSSAYETPRTGTLSYNGRTVGKATVNVRTTGDGKGTILNEWIIGERLVVYGENEKGWCEVDIDGTHGFVQAKYVTLDEVPETDE